MSRQCEKHGSDILSSGFCAWCEDEARDRISSDDHIPPGVPVPPPTRPDVPPELEKLVDAYDAACAEYAIYVQSDKPSSARRIEAKLKRGAARAALLSAYRPQVPTLAAQSNVGTPPMEILREFFHKGDVGSVSRRSWDIARDAFQKLATPKPQAEAHEADTREALARHLWKQHFEGTEMEGSWSIGKETQAHFYGEADKILSILSKSPPKEEPARPTIPWGAWPVEVVSLEEMKRLYPAKNEGNPMEGKP